MFYVLVDNIDVWYRVSIYMYMYYIFFMFSIEKKWLVYIVWKMNYISLGINKEGYMNYKKLVYKINKIVI